MSGGLPAVCKISAHRLEAYKRLGWKEIECNIMEISGLQAELAEIDENIVRHDVDPMDMDDLLLHRKEIYEALHPETKATVGRELAAKRWHATEPGSPASSKTFVEDTAEKMGVTPRTVEKRIQRAKNLTPEVKKIIKKSDIKVHDSEKLSRIKEPEKQKEVAERLARHEIKTVEEALPPKPATAPPKEPEPIPKPQKEPERKPSTKELIAQLRTPVDASGFTIDMLVDSMRESGESFAESIKTELTQYSTYLADAESRKKVVVVLDGIISQINKLKEIVR